MKCGDSRPRLSAPFAFGYEENHIPEKSFPSRELGAGRDASTPPEGRFAPSGCAQHDRILLVVPHPPASQFSLSC